MRAASTYRAARRNAARAAGKLNLWDNPKARREPYQPGRPNRRDRSPLADWLRAHPHKGERAMLRSAMRAAA